MDQGGEEGGSATISSLFHSLGRSLGSSQASVLNAAMQNLVNFELCLLWCIVVPVFILWTDILFSFSYRMLKVLVFLLGKWDILPLYSQCKILCISYHLFILKQYRKCRFFFFCHSSTSAHIYFASIPIFQCLNSSSFLISVKYILTHYSFLHLRNYSD